MEYTEILTETRGRVGIITLNRPERRNALSPTMGDEMREAVEAYNADPGIGAVVLTGVDPAFCGGADVGDWKRSLDDSNEADRERARLGREENWVHFWARSKPIICAVNGPSIGAGLTMTLSADVRIASDRARFSMRFVRMGIIPELASTKLLPLIVGFNRALELMLTGKTIDAQEAERIGLVSRVVPHDRLMEEAVALAADVAFNPTESLQAIKKLTWTNLVESDLQKVMTSEGQELLAAALRPAFGEAVNAFLEKRQPDFHKPFA
jgi:2-(1,2-epoxy-1,2-dihydrophenyl)acetyl-CoA isomerase